MKLTAQPATVFARGCDTIATITPKYAAWLKANGYDYVCRYLGGVTPKELADILGAGLAFMPVCYAGRFGGPKELAALRALGLPSGVTSWCDVEGVTMPAADLITVLNARSTIVRAGSFDPGGYFGFDPELTGLEMGALVIDRYWKAMSKIVGRDNLVAEPTSPHGPIGWCHMQLNPGNVIRGGVKIDVDIIQEDFRGRVPTWCIGIP